MANSTRSLVMSAIVTSLEGIATSAYITSTLALVSESLPEHIGAIDMKNLPAVFPIDGDEDYESSSIGSGTNDIEARLQVVVTCVVFDKDNSTRQARTDLIRDVTKALLNDSALDALINYIEPVRTTTDQGIVQNYSIWDQEFVVNYEYTSANGG